MNLKKVFYCYSLLLVFIFCACEKINNNNQESFEFKLASDSQQERISNLLSRKVERPKHDTLSIEEINHFEHGDILLRKGYGFASDFISVFLEEKYVVTHCGIVIKDSLNPSKINILHTVTTSEHDGMILEPLEKFIEDSQINSLALVRTNFSTKEIIAAINKALEFLEQKILFDMDFNDADDSKYYCVEMVRNAFLPIVNKDILPRRIKKMNKEVTHMSNFFDSTYFTTIINHNIAQY